MRRYRKLFEKSAGVITLADLQKSFPQLANEYVGVFGNKRPKISVEAQEEYSFHGSPGDGMKAIDVLFRDGVTKRIEGSWGGANMYTQTITDSGRSTPIQPDAAILHCVIGGWNGCYLFIHPSAVETVVPATLPVELDKYEKEIIRIVGGITSSYRKSQWDRNFSYSTPPAEKVRIWNETVEKLKGKGLVSVNKVGSVALTIAGKNVFSVTRNN